MTISANMPAASDNRDLLSRSPIVAITAAHARPQMTATAARRESSAGTIRLPAAAQHSRPGRVPVLAPGVVLAIEPMVVAGRREIRHLDDGWSVVTADGRRAAHVEHTVAVTENGPEILTRV